jgi:hypothetical protein
MSLVHLRRLLLPALLLAILLIVTGQAQTAHAACTPGTLLCDRFGVELKLAPNAGGGVPGGTGLPFDLTSFVPTNPSPTIDYIVGDWYGIWSLTSIGSHTTVNLPGATNNWWPSGSEPYDTEAYYFDNDAENFYLAIVSSIPPYQYIGAGIQRWGVYETGRGVNGLWIPPSDIAIDLNVGQPAPRAEALGTVWHYNYGLNLVHENRDSFTFVGGNSSADARDFSIGTDLWKTSTDSQPINQSADNPAAGLSDWYTAVGLGAVYAYGEHTSFDPLSTRNIASPAMTKVGDVTLVNWYEYIFPGGQLENDTGTYIVEVVIPRALFGNDNPTGGQQIAFRYGTTCRNDGNGNGSAGDPMLKLVATVDDFDWGDAPDGPYPTLKASAGANHILLPTGPFMGALVDAENDGQPSLGADGDDLNPAGKPDDEDGVAFVSSLIPGQVATIKVDMTASPAACTLSAWVDFNIANAWSDPLDQLVFQTCPTCTPAVPPATPNPVLPAGQVHTLTFNVPGGATLGTTYARFRCTTAGPLPPTGTAPNGEVEDYQVVISEESLDWGDAPNSYGTLASSNGPRHVLLPVGPVLGLVVDAEANGQPSVGADGDDLNGAGPDDEEGVIFTTPIVAGGAAGLQVTASVAPCQLTGWIDFNGNGVFDPGPVPAGEQLVFTPPGAPVAPLAIGPNALTFTVPPNAVPGPTYARFRCATQPQPTPLGLAPDGEVEDYRVTIENTVVDYGDLPDSYATLLASNGPRHVMSQNLFLGACVDNDDDGQPGATAIGDDTGVAGPTTPTTYGTCTPANDDEDGVTLVTPLIPGNQACVAVTANNGVAGVLQGWIDFDGSGAFDAGEALTFTSAGGGAVPAGAVNQNYCFNVPASATFFGGQAYMRFRLSSAGGLSWTGPATDGEVEDYWQPLACVGNYVWHDYDGDGTQDEAGSFGIDGVGVDLTWFGFDNVPGGSGANADITYSTLTAPQGSVTGKYLFCGLTPPNGAGNGGAYQIGIPTPPVTYGLATTFRVGGTDTPINSDGQQSGVNTPITAPPFTLSGVPPFPNLRTDENGAGDQVGTAPAGIGISGFPNNQDDVSTDFGLRATSLDLGDLPNTSTTTFATQKTFNGPSHVLDNNLYLGACVDGETDGQQGTPATGDDTNTGGPAVQTLGTCATAGDDEDGVTLVTPLIAGQQACVEVTAKNTLPGSLPAVLQGWIDFDGNNNFTAAEALTFTSAGGGTVPTGGVTNQQYCFTVPSGATFSGGKAYMRFRLSSAGSLSWTGPADNGEVEDYRTPLACIGNYVWYDTGATANVQDSEDAPISGQTVRMVWAGPDGIIQTALNATTAAGDDLIYSTTTSATGIYSFCGLPGGLAGSVYQVKITSGNLPAGGDTAVTPLQGGNLNRDSNGTQAAAGADVDGGTVTIPDLSANFLVTGENGNGDARINSYPDNQDQINIDFGFGIKIADWGDNPDAANGTAAGNYQTRAVDAGPWHIMNTSMYLGACVDSENNGQPADSTSTGDDLALGATVYGTACTDDEDGVALTAGQNWLPNATVQLNITVVGTSGRLGCWFDWNADGDYADAGEFVDGGTRSTGLAPLNVTIPAGGVPSGGLYARCRFATNTQFPGSSLTSGDFTGLATGGEVEDYFWPNSSLAVLLASFDATAQADHVLVAWETVSEASNSGFNLYRSLSADGEYALLGFTPSAAPGSTQGAAYSYQDFDVAAGQTYSYKLEDVDLNGAATMHDPVSVVFQAPTAVELSGLAADGGPGSLALPSLLAALLAASAAALLVDRRRRSAA